MRDGQVGDEERDAFDADRITRSEEQSKWYRRPVDFGPILFGIALVFFSLYLVTSQVLYYHDRLERQQETLALKKELAKFNDVSDCRAKYALAVTKADIEHQFAIGEVARVRIQAQDLQDVSNQLTVAAEALKLAVISRDFWESNPTVPCPL